VALIEAAPDIATPDYLLQKVWPGLVVNVETVAQRVKLLRTALADDPRQPRYVAVVRGRGYRLVPAVVQSHEKRATVAPVAAPSVYARMLIPGALLGVLIVAFGLFRILHPTAAPTASSTNARSIAVLPFQSFGVSSGDRVLALGIAEAILHQLANLGDLAVISRSSSFSIDAGHGDARGIGKRLGVQYLLEGSLQRADSKLRVTAQLTDARTGAQVWSLQFDRNPADVFAVQDDIALKVAQALELGLDPALKARLSGQGTTNFDAYFEVLQARDLLADARIADMQPAADHLTQAIRLDSRYAAAYVELAGATLRRAEFDSAGNRRAQFDAAVLRATDLIEQALAIDPGYGPAYLQRAYLRAFSDVESAEADYRFGLKLVPSDAAGHEGLAAVLYQDPARHDEALAALEHAARLDPLNPRYAVTKAVFLLYGRSDATDAAAILEATVKSYPRYAPALMRLGEIDWCCRGETAIGIRHLEAALALDASSEWTRRALVEAYLEVDDLAAAQAVIAAAPEIAPIRELPISLYRRQWVRAAAIAKAALDEDAVLAIDENFVALALRRHARAVPAELPADLSLLEGLAGIAWTAQGEPIFGAQFDMKSFHVGVVDLLVQSGEVERARVLVRGMVALMDKDARAQRPGGSWTRMARAEVLGLVGDANGAMESLDLAVRENFVYDKQWMHLQLEPAFDGIRARPQFRQLVADVRTHVDAQRRAVDVLRREGQVPVRAIGH
jgi:TolB-like protein